MNKAIQSKARCIWPDALTHTAIIENGFVDLASTPQLGLYSLCDETELDLAEFWIPRSTSNFVAIR